MANVGAWFLGGYRKGMAGTLGESLDLADLDNLGWTLRAIKYELAFCGFQGKMVLDAPALGDAAHTAIVAFQTAHGIGADGIVGPKTAEPLLESRISTASATFGARPSDLRGIVRHESGFDIGAIGYSDHADRGCTQKHVYTGGSGATVNLSQAIRPALAIPRLASQLARLAAVWDEEAAVVSWNIGEGGAEWWFEHGEAMSGSPLWWPGPDDMSARATAYLAAVRTGQP